MLFRSDFIHFYSVDMFGNDIYMASYTGSQCCNSISTNFPSGKAKIVFQTNGSIFRDNGYDGAYIHFYADNSYSGAVHDNIFVNSQSLINGNSLVSGKLAVGMLQPSKRFEVWDGKSARFTFSGNTCTSGYEVAQTIDDNGYKLNVGSSVRNYTIALYGVDKFKILKNDNYGFGSSVLNKNIGSYNLALGAFSLMNNTSGSYNVALSSFALWSNTTGNGGVALGNNALRSNTTGNLNIAIGSQSLYSITTGSYNIGIGNNAGRYCLDGSTSNSTSTNSIFIGKDTKASANGQTNQPDSNW